MGNFSNIVAATRNAIGFSFFGANKGDNAIATLKDLKQITDQLNNIFSYRMYDFMIDQQGGLDPVLTKMATGAGECPHNCASICSACDCQTGCNNEAGGGFTYFDFVHTAPGVFEVTVNLPPAFTAKTPAPIKQVALFFSPFANYGDSVIVTPTVAPNVFIVTTYDLSGSPADNVFSNTVVAAKIYF